MKKYIKPELDLCEVIIEDIILASIKERGMFENETDASNLWDI